MKEPIYNPSHEEALHFYANYLRFMQKQMPYSERTIVLSRVFEDVKKMHKFLQVLAEADNVNANHNLAKTGSYDKFRDPRVVEITRQFIQEL